MNEEAAAGQAGIPWPSPRYPLRGPAMVLLVLLAVETAAWLAAPILPVFGAVGEITLIVSMVVFVVWFYRARINAADSGWHQRHSPGWTVGAWFVPVINAYYPLEIMTDIWRAGLPPQARGKRAVLPGIWWACFLIQSPFAASAHPIRIGPLTFYAGMSSYAKAALVLAAIMMAVVVQRVPQSPLGRPPGWGRAA